VFPLVAVFGSLGLSWCLADGAYMYLTRAGQPEPSRDSCYSIPSRPARPTTSRSEADPQTELHSDIFFNTHKAWLYLDDVRREHGPRGANRQTDRHSQEDDEDRMRPRRLPLRSWRGLPLTLKVIRERAGSEAVASRVPMAIVREVIGERMPLLFEPLAQVYDRDPSLTQ